ncbi:hypothetical protein XA68_11376 [Ophiocordyceps unilateralis]|uniref:Uncharacterized protein n=1 Tax=Ophiocordyceps unilateralis TaxID=268505 RepID=A0A2A9PGX8_OPHUN|nr:hypothetical protein XA68_11376 [Ophiocordyceps unilateralis]
MVRLSAALALAFVSAAIAHGEVQASAKSINKIATGKNSSESSINTGQSSTNPAYEERKEQLRKARDQRETDAQKAEQDGNPGLAKSLREQKDGALLQQLSELEKATGE